MTNKWEKISENDVTGVCRHAVDGGWLYTVTIKNVKMFTTTFVPDVDLQRYQAHLRDAYSQGFQDGKADAHAQYAKVAPLS